MADWEDCNRTVYIDLNISDIEKERTGSERIRGSISLSPAVVGVSVHRYSV